MQKPQMQTTILTGDIKKTVLNSRFSLALPIVGYFFFSMALLPLIGPISGAFAIVPAIVAGILRGPWSGLAIGFLCLPVTWLGFLVIGTEEATANIGGMQSYIGHTFVAAIGWGTGYVANLNRQLKHEVNERTQIQQSLNEANLLLAQQARQAAEARSHFLTAVSHKLRTPMNAAHGMMTLLLHSGLTAQQAEIAKDALQGSQDTVSIINAILEYTKAESGALDIEWSKFDLQSCVEDIIQGYTKNQTPRIEIDGSSIRTLPQICFGDSRRISTVLTNAINNAIEAIQRDAIENGEVKLGITTSSHDLPAQLRDTRLLDTNLAQTSAQKIEFSVTDNGNGIPPAILEGVFEPFGTAQNMATDGTSGSGIGLPLCRGLCRSMGGDIEIESKPHEGTTLRFSLLIGCTDDQAIETQDVQDQAEQNSNADEQSTALHRKPEAGPTILEQERGDSTEAPFDDSFASRHPLSILLAEDNFVNAKVAQKMLTKLGYKVDWAKDGQQAVDAFSDKPYDVVLMDIQMPKMNGLEATHSIRQLGSESRQPQIIAVTADTTLEDVKKRQLHRLDSYIGKPIMINTLRDELENAWTLLQELEYEPI